MMSENRPWKFRPLDDITLDEMQGLIKELGTVRARNANTFVVGLARHFIHEGTGERAVGTSTSVDPDEAYARAMKVCG